MYEFSRFVFSSLQVNVSPDHHHHQFIIIRFIMRYQRN